LSSLPQLKEEAREREKAVLVSVGRNLCFSLQSFFSLSLPSLFSLSETISFS